MNLPPNVEGGRRGRRMIWGHEVIVGFDLVKNKSLLMLKKCWFYWCFWEINH